MIQDAFRKEEGMLSPGLFYSQGEQPFQVLIMTFSQQLMESLLQDGRIRRSRDVRTSINGDQYLYEVVGHEQIGLFKTGIGAPISVCNAEELTYITGAQHVITFGSCGALDSEITAGKIIIPDRAWRDEGTSYHYMPASDWIEMKGAAALARMFAEWHVPYVSGGNWTTDALYRETAGAAAKHRTDGCISCDMEASALEAWSQYRGRGFYTFFYSADALEETGWDRRILGGEGEISPVGALFNLAVAVGSQLLK
jgi:uridine phosphorylase